MMPGMVLSAIDSAHIDEISSARGEPDWLKKHRRDSLAIYNDLPVETSPLYNKYTDAARMDAEQVSLAADSDPRVPGFLGRRIAELKNDIHVIQVGTDVRCTGTPEGTVISSIGEALASSPDLVRRALESSDLREDRFTALNNAAFNTGIFIHIPKGMEVEGQIHILSCLPEGGASAISRNVILAEESSRATIVQELYSPRRDGQQAYLELLNTSVGAGAHLDVTTLQMMDPGSVNFSTRHSDVSQDGRINWYLGLFGTMLSRYRIDYHLNGPGAQVSDSEVAFGNAEQSFDIQSNINHEAPSTEGRITEKSILRDKSRSLFKGMIRIKENAAKSNSYLSGRSILLDAGAKSDSIPGLEILTNDVKATHSASVAQIDDEQIFYLQSRCLDRREAERTIVEGFLEPLSRKMSYQVRAWIAYLVESKWEGRELMINTDEELRRFVEVEETRYNEDEEIEQHYKYR